jgi:hypothetical protein
MRAGMMTTASEPAISSANPVPDYITDRGGIIREFTRLYGLQEVSQTGYLCGAIFGFFEPRSNLFRLLRELPCDEFLRTQ